jgi:hypothetical protein
VTAPSTSLTVAARFCGPPGCANGGYLAGLIARCSPQVLCVRLERPTPLDQALELFAEADGGLRLEHSGTILARAQPTSLALQVPPALGYRDALEASRHFVGFTQHAFPRCFVCGPLRARGDGLRIFAGRVAGRDLVAAPWVPDPALAGGDGKVLPEFMGAALDCPGYFAAREDAVPMLLGEFTTHVDRCVHVDEPCVILGWRIRTSGRKYEVGSALFDGSGEPCARARAVWIEPRPGPVATPA